MKAIIICSQLVSYVTLLFSDASDKVLNNGLFVKLLKRNVSVRFVYILRNWYSKLSASVIWKMEWSYWTCLSYSLRSTTRWYFITVAVFSLY